MLAKARIRGSQLRYRAEVERVAAEGVILPPDRPRLDDLCMQLGLLRAEADDIEVKVLQAYRRYQESLEHYRRVFLDAAGKEYPIGERARNRLKDCQDRWGIKSEDISQIESELTQRNQEPKIPDAILEPASSDGSETPGEAIEPKLRGKWLFVAIMLVFGVPIVSLLGMGFFINSARRIIFSEPPQPPRQEIPFPINESRESSPIPIPIPTPTPTSEAEPIEVNNCEITVTNPFEDSPIPGGNASPISLYENPDSRGTSSIGNVGSGKYNVLKKIEPTNEDWDKQNWYQINYEGKLGWIEINNVSSSFLEISQGCL